MNDVSLAGAFLAGLVSFLSPCVLPLVPGYISMLSGIGMEQLRQGEVPSSGLFASALAFVAGFSVVFISFGASASAVGSFLRQNRSLLAPVAGALILLFGLHLIGALITLNLRAGVVLGVILVGLGIAAYFKHAPLFAGLGASHFLSLSLIGFFGPAMARWLNRDVHLRSSATQPGIWSGFLLGFAFAFGWTPCIGPILATEGECEAEEEPAPDPGLRGAAAKVDVAIEPAGHRGAEKADERERQKVRSTQTGKERSVLEISCDSEANKNDTKDDAGAEVELDERADQVKAKEKDQGACDGRKKGAVLSQKRADGAGGGSERNKDDGKAGDKGEGRREQAGGWDITLAELFHADAGEHGDVAGNERQNAGREKRNEPGQKGPC